MAPKETALSVIRSMRSAGSSANSSKSSWIAIRNASRLGVPEKVSSRDPRGAHGLEAAQRQCRGSIDAPANANAPEFGAHATAFSQREWRSSACSHQV